MRQWENHSVEWIFDNEERNIGIDIYPLILGIRVGRTQ